MSLRRAIVLVLLAAALLTGCADDGDTADRATTTSSERRDTSSSVEDASGDSDPTDSVQLTTIGEFREPLAVVVRTGSPVLYVVEKGGRVVTDGGSVVLDIRGEVSTGGEQGLLGLAFHPSQPFLYVDYTDNAGDTHIVEFRFEGARADAASRRELLVVDQPFANHNGGQLAFGPDGFLYIGLGDGGSGGDPGGNGQSLSTVLGKILRIDPTSDGSRSYTIPAGNPFAARRGARGEIWAYGLRNPWRFSFDRANGDLWIGDVGQGEREEVNRQPAASGGGENYGWNVFEGTRRFGRGSTQGLVSPVFEYERADGNCAVIGGFVYRGSVIGGLEGHYVFGDNCKGELLALVERDGALVSVPLGPTVPDLSSFGEGNNGEIYAASLDGTVFRLDAR